MKLVVSALVSVAVLAPPGQAAAADAVVDAAHEVLASSNAVDFTTAHLASVRDGRRAVQDEVASAQGELLEAMAGVHTATTRSESDWAESTIAAIRDRYLERLGLDESVRPDELVTALGIESVSHSDEEVSEARALQRETTARFRRGVDGLASVLAVELGVDPSELRAAWSRVDTQRLTVLAAGVAQRGKPYKYAHDGPNAFDCSGFTRFAWLHAGVELPSYSLAQRDYTDAVAPSEVAAGDLVFWDNGFDRSIGRRAGHVALAIGFENFVVHSASGSKGVVISRWFPENLAGAGRVRIP
jgi:cell wall-associated NlpC family hydrolase